jgi:hypothetical protein
VCQYEALPVPKSDDPISQWLTILIVGEGSCKPKIGKLQNAIVVDKKI